MYSIIRPTYQFVKEHDKDYIYQRNGRFYIHTYYAGLCEITKEEYERLEVLGVERR